LSKKNSNVQSVVNLKFTDCQKLEVKTYKYLSLKKYTKPRYWTLLDNWYR